MIEHNFSAAPRRERLNPKNILYLNVKYLQNSCQRWSQTREGSSKRFVQLRRTLSVLFHFVISFLGLVKCNYGSLALATCLVWVERISLPWYREREKGRRGTDSFSRFLRSHNLNLAGFSTLS